MSGILAAGIAAGVQAASTAGQMAYQSNLNSANRKLFRENRDLQRKWALEDRQHLEEYNDPSAQLNRIEKAGINPMLYNDLGNAGESAMPTNPSNNPIEMSAGNVNFSDTAGSIINAELQQQQLNLNKKKNDAEISNINAQTSLTNIQQGLVAKSKEELEGKIAILGQQLKDLQFEYNLRVKYGDSQMKNTVDSLYYDVQHKRTESHLLNIFGFPEYVAKLTDILASAENTIENTRLASRYAWSAVKNALANMKNADANMKNAKTNEKLSRIPMTEHLIKMEPFATKYVDDDGNVTYHNWMNEYDFDRSFRVGMKQKAFKGSALQNDYLQKNVEWYTYNQILNGISTGVDAASSIYGMRNPVQNPLNMGNTQDTWYDYDKKGKVQHVQRTTRNSYRGR